MKGLLGNLRDNRPLTSAIVVLCLALLLFVSVVQVTHAHQSASEADHCALCLTMHSAAPMLVAVVAAMVLVQLGVPTSLVKARVIVRYWQPQLFTRPPPQS